jgi:hypothetical protein
MLFLSQSLPCNPLVLMDCLQLVQTLRDVCQGASASKAGSGGGIFGSSQERCTVLASVHQPRAAVWEAFDMVRQSREGIWLDGALDTWEDSRRKPQDVSGRQARLSYKMLDCVTRCLIELQDASQIEL